MTIIANTPSKHFRHIMEGKKTSSFVFEIPPLKNNLEPSSYSWRK
jgi:hypothetical protein